MSSSNVETIEQLYAAFGQGDVPAVLSLLSPQVQWRVPVSMPFEDQVGPEAVARNIFAFLVSAYDGFSPAVDEVHDAGDAVFAIGAYQGTGRATGKPLHADFVHVWRFDADGSITYFRSYTDTHVMLEVLGQAQGSTVPAQAAGAEAAAPTSV